MKKKSTSMREGGRGVTRKSSRTAAVAGVTRSKPTTAYELLERVCEHILEEPKRYDQNVWGDVGRQRLRNFHRGAKLPACNTIACRAGWIVALNDGKAGLNSLMDMRAGTPTEHDVAYRAAAILGMNVYQTEDLFAGHDGDTPAMGTAAGARYGVRGIRKFMKTWTSYLKARLLKDVPKLASK